jgi:uncharacterized protein YhfF
MSVRPGLTPSIEAFWRDAVAATPELDPESDFTIYSFGDSPELCRHVLTEILAGRNRATASLRWAYDSRLPEAGDIAIATDWAGAPRAVLVTRRVEIVPYDKVDEDFARAEGYVADPLNEWREVHWAFFSRRCAELGRIASLDMPIVCEWFELVYPRRG